MADEYIITQEDLNQGNEYLRTLTTEYPVCRIVDGVTTIGELAFYRCSNLTSITIPDSVTSIGGNAFRECSSLTSVIIGNGVTSIGGNAFRECSSLTSINIPDSVTTINWYAFAGCIALTSITIPEGVTRISERTFLSCSGLTSITIPDSVVYIDNNVFEGCSSLTSITIPEGVTSINSSVFEGCSSLTSINIPSNVASIGYNAFSGCSSLASINIPDSVITIRGHAFAGCIALTSITIPDSVTDIDNGTFSNCTSLTSITISDSVIYISSYAFSNCTSLTSITIPDSVTDIDYGAFDGCSNLTTVNVGPNFDQTLLEDAGLPSTVQIIVVEPDPEYNQLDERLLVKGNERITRDLKVQGNIFGDSNHKAFLPKIKSDSIELGDGVVRKIAKNAQSGVVSYDATNEKFVTSDDLTLPGDLVVDGQITARKDLSISGDLYVNGTEHINDVETIQSSDDYFVLRHNKSTALGANEHAGIAVHNYALDKTATLTTDNQGIWRVADNSETSTTYTGVSYFNGDYFTGLTQTATTVIDGIKTAYDQDELDECALYNSSYYHFDGINWYSVSLVDNVLTVGAKVDDAAVITALEALTRNDLVYYRSLTVTVINEVQNQPLLTRAEEADLDNGDILAWDGTNKKAVHLPRPTLSNQALKSKITNGVVSYEWGNSGSAGVAFVGTRAQYDVARLIPEGQDGFIPPNSIVKITDEDDYVTGENR